MEASGTARPTSFPPSPVQFPYTDTKPAGWTVGIVQYAEKTGAESLLFYHQSRKATSENTEQDTDVREAGVQYTTWWWKSGGPSAYSTGPKSSAITKGPGVFHNRMKDICWGHWDGVTADGVTVWRDQLGEKRLHFQLNEHRLL